MASKATLLNLPCLGRVYEESQKTKKEKRNPSAAKETSTSRWLCCWFATEEKEVRSHKKEPDLDIISPLDWERALAARSLSSSGESIRTAWNIRSGGQVRSNSDLEDVLIALIDGNRGRDVHRHDAIAFVVLQEGRSVEEEKYAHLG